MREAGGQGSDFVSVTQEVDFGKFLTPSWALVSSSEKWG